MITTEILLKNCCVCNGQATQKKIGAGQIPFYFCRNKDCNSWNISTFGLIRLNSENKIEYLKEPFKIISNEN